MRCRAKSGLWSSLGGLSPGFLHCPGPDSNCAADLGFHYGILIDSTRHSGNRHGPGSLGCTGCCHGAARLMSDVRGPSVARGCLGKRPLAFANGAPSTRNRAIVPGAGELPRRRGRRPWPRVRGPRRGQCQARNVGKAPRPGASFPATCRWQRTTLGVKSNRARAARWGYLPYGAGNRGHAVVQTVLAPPWVCLSTATSLATHRSHIGTRE